MTPKEKALELFSIYRFALSLPNAPLGEDKDSVAKQCALIAVDEILSFIEDDREGFTWKDYYIEVKKEIEKL
jgi:hypothetical protein